MLSAEEVVDARATAADCARDVSPPRVRLRNDRHRALARKMYRRLALVLRARPVAAWLWRAAARDTDADSLPRGAAALDGNREALKSVREFSVRSFVGGRGARRRREADPLQTHAYDRLVTNAGPKRRRRQVGQPPPSACAPPRILSSNQCCLPPLPGFFFFCCCCVAALFCCCCVAAPALPRAARDGDDGGDDDDDDDDGDAFS